MGTSLESVLDHHKWVLPELEKRDLWGIFYAPTGPFAKDFILDVHRIHTLLGAYGGARVLEELQQMVTEEMIPTERIGEFRTETYTRQENSNQTESVKRILNYYVMDGARKKMLDRLLTILPKAEVGVRDLYMTEDQLISLKDAGMIVGSHSISHCVFSNASADRQRNEITESFDYLENAISGLPVRTFCYPYGGFHTFTDKTQQLLRGADCMFAFNVESRDINTDDFRESLLTLPRYDCNEFPHGNASGTLD